MINKLKISVIVENTAAQLLLGEHGLSFLIRTDTHTLLFDTGRGEVIEHNLKELCQSPENIDVLLISHGHYDHTGGIEYLSSHLRPDIKAYLHPAALEPKYSNIPGGFKYLGISDNNREYLLSLGENLILTEGVTEIYDGIFLTGEIPRINSIENRSTKFYLDRELTVPDLMKDDQALFFHSPKGIVVLLGCCHAGLANTLDYVAKTAETDSIHAVIGGTHLRNANQAQLDFAADTLKKYNVKIFAPCHCSGEKSSAYLYSKNPGIFSECAAGTSFIFEGPSAQSLQSFQSLQ